VVPALGDRGDKGHSRNKVFYFFCQYPPFIPLGALIKKKKSLAFDKAEKFA
jgi:hypothetical protein